MLPYIWVRITTTNQMLVYQWRTTWVIMWAVLIEIRMFNKDPVNPWPRGLDWNQRVPTGRDFKPHLAGKIKAEILSEYCFLQFHLNYSGHRLMWLQIMGSAAQYGHFLKQIWILGRKYNYPLSRTKCYSQVGHIIYSLYQFKISQTQNNVKVTVHSYCSIWKVLHGLHECYILCVLNEKLFAFQAILETANAHVRRGFYVRKLGIPWARVI